MRGARCRRSFRRVRSRGYRPAVLAAFAGAALVSAAVTPAPASAASAPPSPSVVAQRLGANEVPAELVILVDTSRSMKWDGLYPVVERELPRFLSALKKQDPRDTVAIVVFGARKDTKTVYLGPPKTKIGLPAKPSSNATDFGYAFEKALGILGRAPATVKVGGVLLLSDGTLNAAGDPRYDGYSAPGWASLRSKARAMHMSLTGYGLPLRADRAGIASVNRALGMVFAHRTTLGPAFGDLGRELGLARQKVMDDRVASAVRPDTGKGIRVAWPALPGSGGAPALDLRQGHADLRLTLTAMTHKVPLDVTGLRVRASGLPVPVTASLTTGSAHLAPGQSLTVPVHLEWPPLQATPSAASVGPVRGRLDVTGHVTSPFTHAIRAGFGDRSFAVGGLNGEDSAVLMAGIPGPFHAGPWLIAVLIAAVAAAVAVGLRTQMGGRLILVPPGHAPVTLTLPRFPLISRSTEKLIGVPGRLTVQGTLRRRRMRLRLRLGDKAGSVVMKPWDQAFVAGVQVIHEPRRGRPPDSGPAPNPDEHRSPSPVSP